MKNWILKYRSLTFEQRTIFNTKFSIGFNAFLAIVKFSLSFLNLAFLVSGIVNICLMLAKLECLLGVIHPRKRAFKKRNSLIALFLILAGIQYTFYMGRLIFTSAESSQYYMSVGLVIACSSFVEMGIAIRGCFSASGRGHYYRNIKLISLCSALTAIALTEMAIMSFSNQSSTKEFDGIFGVCVGAIIILLGIYVYFAPKISILDHRYHRYILTQNSNISSDDLTLEITNSYIYGNFVYVAILRDGMVEGLIFKRKSPIRQWNIFLKIFIIILSEILIFPYALGGLIFYFRSGKIVKSLDNKMKELGCIPLMDGELYD
ncbi:MAG: hypothetical protein K2I42_03970 [Anaeroplasmataceae bacterium]|nr:hypothetical protein [Anaeroplasmataceae bacterium]